MTRTALTLLNGIYEWTVGAVIAAAALFSLYSIWDNAQIYQAAKDVQSQIQQLKPNVEAEGGPGFDELRALNEDVIGWITVDETNIDYPVLLGENNLEYMDKDVYGDFSLAGSIFLDTRNKADFSDNYSLIYGHNMDEHLMFGDLELFKDKKFFEKNTTATLQIPGESRDLKVAAVLQLSAGTEEIFDPTVWSDSLDGLGVFLEKNSVWYHSAIISELKTYPGKYKVVSLVTCSGGSTNDRTILILVWEDPDYVPPAVEKTPGSITPGSSVPGSRDPVPDSSSEPTPDSVVKGTQTSHSLPKTGDLQNKEFWIKIIIGMLIVIFLYECWDRRMDRNMD